MTRSGRAFIGLASLALEAFRRVARPRAQFARDRDLEDLHLVGGADLVVAQVARDEERIAFFDLERAALLELQLDPALEDVDELAVALVIVPAGRLAEALGRLHHLGAHGAGAALAHAEIAIGEEVAPSLDQHRLGDAGMGDLLAGSLWRGERR